MSIGQPNWERVLPARRGDSIADQGHPSRFSHLRCTRGVRENGRRAPATAPSHRDAQPMGRQWKPAGRRQQAGSCRAVIQCTWLFNAAYCSPQFFLSLQDKCDHCSVCFTSLPQQHSIHHRVLLGGRIRLCRYNNSIHHRRAGVGKQRFVNDSGSLAAPIPPISLTGNTSVPSSPRAAQPEEPDPLPPWTLPLRRAPTRECLGAGGGEGSHRQASPSESTQSSGSAKSGGAGTPAAVPQPWVML